MSSLPTEAHRELFKRVGEFLVKDWGEAQVEKYDDNSYRLWMGSTVVYVEVVSYGREEDPKPAVNVWARTALRVPYSSRLAEYLVQENRRFIFGAFNFYPYSDNPSQGNIIFEITVPGSGLDLETLRVLVGMVGSTSDHYDEKIVSEFGGQTAEESAQSSSSQDKEISGGDELWE